LEENYKLRIKFE